MSRRTECPECGGPIVDGGGDDVRCVECGLTYDEFSEVADEEDFYDGDNDDDFDDMDEEGFDAADW